MFTGFIRLTQVFRLPFLVSILLLAGIFHQPVTVKAQATDCQRRTVLVSVIDRQGSPAANFHADSFQSTYRGKAVRILSAQVESKPRRIVVVLDVSGSMQGPRAQWGLARRAAGDLIASIPAGSSIALITFGDRIYENVGLAQNPQEALTKIEALQDPSTTKTKVGGRTALFDALMAAVNVLSPAQLGDTVYVITHGGENASKSRERDVEMALAKARIRLFGFVFALRPGPTAILPEIREGPPLQRLMRSTGGDATVVYFDEPTRTVRSVSLSDGERSAIAQEARKKYQQITDFYRLEIELPTSIDKPREWKLELVSSEGVNAKDFRVVYPRKLLPCQSP